MTISYQNPAYIPVPPSVQPIVKRNKTDYIINKVIQALDILEQFRDDVDELSLGQLGKRVSLQENYLLPLLTTLKSRNYLEQNNSTKAYRLGFKTLELAQTLLRQVDLYRVSHPVLAAIFAGCGETTAVAVLSKTHVIELDAIHAEHPVRVVSRVGVHLPAHCTAAGKALLAAQPAEELADIFPWMEFAEITDRTIVSVDELRAELGQIAERGYAVDDQESDREVRSVAAAIHDYAGAVVGAVVITGPSCRLSMERINGELAPLVLNAAREISLRLGFHESDSEQSVREQGEKVASKRTRIPPSHQKRKVGRPPRAA